MPTTTTPPPAGRSALRILAAKRNLVAECSRLNIPIQRAAWVKTIDLAIPKWGKYSRLLWDDYATALLALAGVPEIAGVKKGSDASAIEWLSRPKGEQAALVMQAWARLGWDENPAGSNEVPELAAVCRRLGLSSWYADMGWAWCDFSAHVAGLVVGSEACAAGVGATHRYNGLYTVESLEIADAGRYGWKPVPKQNARLGTKGWIDFQGGEKSGVDHTFWILGAPGQVCFGMAPAATEVVTAEGNTSGEGESGSQSNGGRLAIRKRPLALIAGVATPTK